MTVFLDKRKLWKGVNLASNLSAVQVHTLLKKKASKAFKKNALESGVLERCLAIAVKNKKRNAFSGRTNRALLLLQLAGENADRYNRKKVHIGNVDFAFTKFKNVYALSDTIEEFSEKKRIERDDKYSEIYYTAPINKIKQAVKCKTGGLFWSILKFSEEEACGNYYIYRSGKDITCVKLVRRHIK